MLASASPRRREILTSLGIEFETIVPSVEELTEGDPEQVVLQNARRKATAGLEHAPLESLVLGVDTEALVGAAADASSPPSSEHPTRTVANSPRSTPIVRGARKRGRDMAPDVRSTERTAGRGLDRGPRFVVRTP